MSECVVRMEMPDSCDVCPCLDDYGDYPRCRISEEQRGYNFPIHEKRMPNCPIICSLPEGHGRLVDMRDIDSMMEDIQTTSDESGLYGLYYRDDFDFDCLPTIVPATEGGKE